VLLSYANPSGARRGGQWCRHPHRGGAAPPAPAGRCRLMSGGAPLRIPHAPVILRQPADVTTWSLRVQPG